MTPLSPCTCTPAREAGVSIKPRVERGFASATLGTRVRKTEAREAGDSIDRRTLASVRVVCRPLRGLTHYSRLAPRVALAKPRSTLGSMLPPASRASVFFNACTSLFSSAVHLKDFVEECRRGRVDLQDIRMSHEVMRVVGNHDLLKTHASFLQSPYEIGCLTKTNVAIVVAVNQQHRRLPRINR